MTGIAGPELCVGAVAVLDGRLLLIEAPLSPRNEPALHKLMDINMLVMTGGRERTEDEYRALLAAAGFELTRVIVTPLELGVLEASRR